MAKTKTKPTKVSVKSFLDKAAGEKRREDCETLVKLMKKITRTEPYMWGPSIVGFGSYHYQYDSGHEGDAPLAGFSPRTGSLVIYVLMDFEGQPELMTRLGKHTRGKVCLYVKSLSDVDIKVLEELIKRSVSRAKKTWG